MVGGDRGDLGTHAGLRLLHGLRACGGWMVSSVGGGVCVCVRGDWGLGKVWKKRSEKIGEFTCLCMQWNLYNRLVTLCGSHVSINQGWSFTYCL